MIALGVATAFLLVLFLRWKTRYRYPPRDVPQILCYHKLSSRFCFEGAWMPPARFLDQIDRLVGEGFEFIGEDSFLEALDGSLPRRDTEILLTFDDGYDELYDMCLGHLIPRGIPLLIFLPTEYVGKENAWDLSLGRRPFTHLSRPRIEELVRHGVRFGSHGARHLDLTCLNETELEREVSGSKKTLEEITGTQVKTFAYPFGRYHARIKSTVQEAGYQAAFSLYPAHSNEVTDRFALRRNGVYIIDTPLTVRCKLRPNPLYWFEEMKCRAINGVAVLTPVIKRFSAGPGK